MYVPHNYIRNIKFITTIVYNYMTLYSDELTLCHKYQNGLPQKSVEAIIYMTLYYDNY